MNYTNKTQDGFTMVMNGAVNDKQLSWKAKGLLLYLLSKKTGWKFYESEIQLNSTDGLSSVKSGLKELIEFGYLERTQIRTETGFGGYEYEIHGKPIIRKSINRESQANKTNNSKTNKMLLSKDKRVQAPIMKRKISKPSRKHIDLLCKVFEDYYGTKCKQRDRQASSNLFKSYGMEIIDIAKIIIKARETDQYAPIISSPSDLQDKIQKVSAYFKDKQFENNREKGVIYV